MKDIVVEGYLKAFVDNFGFQDMDESIQFERFCSYSTLNKEFNYTLSNEDLNDISIEKNKGVDSIAFYVNGELVKNKEQLYEIKKASKQKLSIKLYFIQSKTSNSFVDSEIANFLDTITDFLTKSPSYPLTPEAKQYHEVFLAIQSDFGVVKDYNMVAFFCCLGNWEDNTTCAVTLSNKKEDIKKTELFNHVEINPIGKGRLIELYKKTSNPISVTFDFPTRISIKKIDNVEEAYIGYVSFKEFRKLIVDDDNGKLKNLFNDNIRDFLGIDNEVNEKISQTLKDGDFSQFSLLNNGVTIVAEENTGRQDKFILNNYQIVNGCQTSNVLYESLSINGIDDTLIPIKLIITRDDTLRDKIILSTNSQTKINKEGLLALTKFQKQLEEYYYSANDNLYYERRSNQYYNKPEVKRKSIVDIREQIKSFVAMFLDEPHEVSGYFSRVYKERQGDIFIEEHLLEPYYISGLIQFRFKEFLNSREIDRKYNKARYHVFMLFRMIEEAEPFNKEFLSKKKKKIYFENLLRVIRSKEKCMSGFKKTFAIIDASRINVLNAKEIYKTTTTATLIESFKKTPKEDVE